MPEPVPPLEGLNNHLSTKIYDRSHEPEINRAGTWTFDQLCAPMDLRARTGGEAPASRRLKTWI
jgi:hypothetical protein